MIGLTIGAYEVQSIVGQGGMGVVYRAEDTKLKRPVALKFLSPAAIQDGESHQRFLQEAQAAAALDHPNICGVYQIDEHNGRWFIAMPFLEGQSLEDRIASGPLKIAEAVEIARQMAEGLEEAHNKHVVHRDIKPANAIVSERSRGRIHVTLMDFGLARLANATRLTRDGRQMGTAAYMSPEQVVGESADGRTDIWSLGVVLYEITVGQHPFPAEYEQAIFYGIQNEQPEPLTALRSGVPMELERIVMKCMAKEPNERYQTCSDLLVDLNALARELNEGRTRSSRKSVGTPSVESVETSDASTAVEALPAPSAASGRFSVTQLIAATLVAGLLSAVAVWLSIQGRPSTEAIATVVPDYKLERITWDGELNVYPTLSPDGNLLAYSSDRAGQDNLDIWVQQVAGGGLIRITDDPADEKHAVFSPDGAQLAFARSGDALFTVPAIGGEPYLVADGAEHPDFSPDGKKLVYTKQGADGGIFYAPVSMGKPVQLFGDFRSLGTPLWSPDGSSVIAWGRSASQEVDWWSAPIDGGEPVPIGAAQVFQQGPNRDIVNRIDRGHGEHISGEEDVLVEDVLYALGRNQHHDRENEIHQ